LLFRVEQNEAWIFAVTGTVKLSPVSGQNSGDADVWIDDSNENRVEIDAENKVHITVERQRFCCVNNTRIAVWEHVKLNGVSFRGMGNEPGWYLEIYRGEKLVLVSNYGEVRIVEPYPRPVVSRSDRTTTWQSGALNITVSGKQCTDRLSGDVFESTVLVEWGEKQLNGCGKSLH
jgi:hypothetical protein